MGFVPPRPRAAVPRYTGAQMRTQDSETSVTAAPGSSLWSIVAAHLGPAATDWEIAREWPRWHQANSVLIGEDPAHLPSGTVLRKPPQ